MIGFAKDLRDCAAYLRSWQPFKQFCYTESGKDHHYITACVAGAVAIDRIGKLEAALAKEKGGWDAFYKLRKSVGEDRYPGLTGEMTASETRKETQMPIGANEFFEIVGELYHDRYHRLRPGKDDPMQNSSDPENVEQFKQWVQGPLAFNDAIECISRLNRYVTKLEDQL